MKTNVHRKAVVAITNTGGLKSAIRTPDGYPSGPQSAIATMRNPQPANKTVGFRDATREQQSILAPAERRALHWLAARMPACVNSDHLTLLGFAAMAAAGVCYLTARWWAPALLLVNVCLALNWFGDSLDGTLARFRAQLRPRYGFYVDHIVDAFGALFMFGGLAASGYMSERVAVQLLVAYFFLSINVYLATYTLGTFKLSFWKFSPTELRILMALGNVVAFFRPRVLGGQWLFFDVAGSIGLCVLIVLIFVSVVRNTVTLYRQETLRR